MIIWVIIANDLDRIYGEKADQVEHESLWIIITAMCLPLLDSFAISLMQLNSLLLGRHITCCYKYEFRDIQFSWRMLRYI